LLQAAGAVDLLTNVDDECASFECRGMRFELGVLAVDRLGMDRAVHPPAPP
jgi:hypothetical protein